MKVTISDSSGIKTEAAGSGLVIDSTLSTSPSISVSALTAASTLTAGGVFTVSSSTGAVTTVMPLASSVPGAMFVFRATSAHAHTFTGSQEAAGTKVFCGHPGTSVANQGSNLALPAVIGSSVALVSDGKSFLLSALSGSCTINGL